MLKMMLAQEVGRTFWMPPEASRFAGEIDWVFYFIFWISALFFVIIAGFMFTFMIVYRRKKPGDEAIAQITHNTTLELVWSIVPGVLLIFFFWWGFTGFMTMRTPPANAYVINVRAYKWAWEFTYPGGIVTNELHAEVGQPVRLVMRSDDVIHSCYIPAFRVKRDVVPGRYSELWFEATETGTFPLFCAEYCGKDHSNMRAVVQIHERGGFAKWLETADPLKALPDELFAEYAKDPEGFIEQYKDDAEWGKYVSKLETPEMIGEKLYNKKACVSCHRIDGAPSEGPPLNLVFTRTDRTFEDGTTLPPDMSIESYIRESILEPNKRRVSGFAAAMSKIQVSDREIDCLIAFIRSLKDKK